MTETAASATTLQAQGLTRRYGTQTAVDGIDLSLKRGEVLGLLGPNGAGKSTTMQMLTGNLAPSAGSVHIRGIDLIDFPVAAKAHLGYLPETPPLYRDLNVTEFIDLVARLHRVPRTQCKAAVNAAVTRCGLAEVRNKLISALSKGFQQRVGIAQAIVHEPDVIILDEPTVGLDPNQIREIRTLIRELGNTHSVILSTHILPEVEAICDNVRIMHRGRFVFGGSIAELRAFHGGQTLLVGLNNAPAVAELSELLATAGVTHVDVAGDNLYRLRVAEDAAGKDPAARIAALAAERQWGLTQIAPAQASLEDVFVQLTTEENAS